MFQRKNQFLNKSKIFFIVFFSFVFCSSIAREFYLLKMVDLNSDYYAYLLMPKRILHEKVKQKDSSITFADYLVNSYSSFFLIDDPDEVDLLGCCGLGDVPKAQLLIAKGQIDSVNFIKYARIKQKTKMDSLFRFSPLFNVQLDGSTYQVSLIKVNCDFCVCGKYFNGGNLPEHSKYVAMLNRVYSIRNISTKEKNKFKRKFNNF